MSVTPAETTDVETGVGLARVHLHRGGRPLLVLGHGAGGGIDAPDLVASASAAASLGWSVALVEQPWRVRGRRIAEAPKRLDAAWLDVLATLDGTPLVTGGRSAGARVACRTAAQVGADAVVCLAFPLHPPGRPERSRLPELEGVGVPVLVVQGSRDPFGVPPGAHVIDGADHGLNIPGVNAAVRAFLAGLTQTLT